MQNLLSEEHIDAFRSSGVLVIENVLSEEEVDIALGGFHECLGVAGCDVADLENTGKSLSALSSTGGAGGILDIYWADFKLKVAENEKINRIMSELWASTYASETHDLWRHNHGSFDPFQPLAAIDRVCFRLPDTLSLQLGENAKPLQRHLAPHLDCCPHSDNNESMKWRPIQAFVSLSNTVEDNHGGFECCPNHHTSFGEWAETREWGTKAQKGGGEESVPPPCLGAFSPMRPKEDAAVLDKFTHIPVRRGGMVVWDNRIPHANSRYHRGETPREVIYLGILPNVEKNRKYVEEQKKRFADGRLPVDFWIGKGREASRQLSSYPFSPFGEKIMMF